jgi:hypothetical protein
MSLVYIHIGTDLPDTIYDSIYQTLLLNNYNTKIYVILDDSVVDQFKKNVDNFCFDIYVKTPFFYNNILNIIPISILDRSLNDDSNFDTYKNCVSEKFGELAQFRNGFWISTTARFYYISMLMKMFNLSNVFHIENDVMLYSNINNLYNVIKGISSEGPKNCMIQDSPKRVVPSLLFFPNTSCLNDLTAFITNELLKSDKFINDMDILGAYENKYLLPFQSNGGKVIFDGAALGQYLGGIDYKNIPNWNDVIKYNNPTRGFINETAIVKASDYLFFKSKVTNEHLTTTINVPMVQAKNVNNVNEIANLHIHSKQLYQFSSIFDIQWDDIITGDRVCSLADFVILTKEIYNFHQNINDYARDIIMIKDFTNVNIKLLNKYFGDFSKKTGKKVINLFIYTHILEDFTKYIFPFLDDQLKYTLYIHNSDHQFDNKFDKLIHSEKIKFIYTQNIDIGIDTGEKVKALPIGLANSMWKHGNLVQFYTVLKDTWKYKKEKNIYVNINPNTYPYRKVLLDKMKEKDNFNLATSKPYIDYLYELASNRFCLCIRGNGIDTHRFWESLYLGVIPVIINNKKTECNNFVNYLKMMDIPFYEIKNDNIDMMFERYTDSFFNENLYNSILKGKNIFDLPSLKMSHYQSL